MLKSFGLLFFAFSLHNSSFAQENLNLLECSINVNSLSSITVWQRPDSSMYLEKKMTNGQMQLEELEVSSADHLREIYLGQYGELELSLVKKRMDQVYYNWNLISRDYNRSYSNFVDCRE